MKKLINFENHKEIQLLADKKYGGNFSLAVNSVMNLALESDDFCNDVDKSERPIRGDLITHENIIEFANYIKSDHAKLANFPDRFMDAAIAGIDASLFNERLRDLFTCSSDESRSFASSVIYDSMPITENCKYIKTASELASTWLRSGSRERKSHKSEAQYHQIIVENFKDYFSRYDFTGNEVVTKDGADRIDILARCSETGRDVIIELKVGNKSAHKQLRSYAYEFENPILINISEYDVRNKRDGIIYLTYTDIGVLIDEIN